MHRGYTLRLDLSRSSEHKACAANSPHLTTPRPRGVKMLYSRVSILSRAGEYGLAPFNNQAHGGIARLDTRILHSSRFVPFPGRYRFVCRSYGFAVWPTFILARLCEFRQFAPGGVSVFVRLLDG